MFETILGAITPVLLTAVLGFFWTRFERRFDSTSMTELVTDIGTPCLVFSTYAKMDVPPAAFAGSAVATVTIITAVLACAAFVLRVTGLSLRTYLPSMAFANTGNLGLPLVLYAFGPEGLAFAIVFLTFNSIANFTIGQAVAAGTVNWLGILRMPILYAAPLGITAAGLHLPLPDWLNNTVSLLGSLTVPLMLLMLGVSLAQLRVAALPRAFALSMLRIGLGAGIGFVVTALFGLHGPARAALVMQSSMPAAVFNYLFALRWNNHPEEVAGIVVVSTLVTIFTAPLLLYLLIT